MVTNTTDTEGDYERGTWTFDPVSGDTTWTHKTSDHVNLPAFDPEDLGGLDADPKTKRKTQVAVGKYGAEGERRLSIAQSVDRQPDVSHEIETSGGSRNDRIEEITNLALTYHQSIAPEGFTTWDWVQTGAAVAGIGQPTTLLGLVDQEGLELKTIVTKHNTGTHTKEWWFSPAVLNMPIGIESTGEEDSYSCDGVPGAYTHCFDNVANAPGTTVLSAGLYNPGGRASGQGSNQNNPIRAKVETKSYWEAVWDGFGDGLYLGAVNLADTFTFGLNDDLSSHNAQLWRESGLDGTWTQTFTNIGAGAVRESLIALTTLGMGNAVTAARGANYARTAIAANIAHKGLLGYEIGSTIYDVGVGAYEISQGNPWGLLNIGLAAILGSVALARGKNVDIFPSTKRVTQPSSVDSVVSKSAPNSVNKQAVQEALENGTLREISSRSRLIKAASDAQHHIFTQARRLWCKNRYNIDVDDFTVDVDDITHQALHAGKGPLGNKAGWWDEELISRIKDAEETLGRKLNRSEVLDIGNKMLERFGLDDLPVKPYNN